MTNEVLEINWPTIHLERALVRLYDESVDLIWSLWLYLLNGGARQYLYVGKYNDLIKFDIFVSIIYSCIGKFIHLYSA